MSDSSTLRGTSKKWFVTTCTVENLAPLWEADETEFRKQEDSLLPSRFLM